MRITTLLLMITLFQLQANDSFGQKTKVSLNLIDVSLETVFNKIESITDYKFVFKDKEIDYKRKISITVTKEELSEVLKKLFVNTKIGFSLHRKQIILKSKNEGVTILTYQSKNLQKIKISGVVTDATNNPLPGATIIIKGTNLGTDTDFDGKFTMDVDDENTVLVISFLGFANKEIVVGKETFFNIILKEDASQLDEVVVVGYGSQKKSKLSGSISTVQIGDLQDYPVSNFDQALVGKLAGVQVLQTSGEPGRELTIKVRGTSTITAGANPLYVVDGVPLESAGQATEIVNMEDIESIQILKDASSAAIYGSRGNNGVVIISTKKGKEGKMKVSFDQSMAFQQLSKKIKMMDAYQYARLSKEGHDAAYLQEVPTGDASDPNSIRPTGYHKIPEELLPYIDGVQGLTNTDWQDEIYRNAVMQRFNVTVSGASKGFNYYVSVNRSHQEGIILNSDYAKTGFRANLNLTSGKFKIGLNMSPSYTLENRVSANNPWTDNGIVSAALSYSPTWPVYNPDGSFNQQGNGYWRIGTDYQHNEILNPVALSLLPKNQIAHYNILSNVFVEYEIVEDLKIKSSLAINYNQYKNEFYRPKELETRGSRNFGRLSNPSARLSSTNIFNWLFENTATYQKKFGLHSLDLLGGITAQKNSNKLQRIDASVTSDTPVNNATQVINADQISNSDAGISEWSLYSLLARVQYDYDGKYLVSASIRGDASSRFGANKKWGYFPSIATGWRISEEEFASKLGWLSELKLRASYGLTGNFNIGNYEQIALISRDSYITGNPGQIQTGLRPSQIANPDLSWEQTAMFNTGLDIEIFKKQLGFTFEYYNGNTSNLLLDVPVPLTTGFSRALQNIGKVNNSGFEASVNIAPNFGKNFTWNSNFNISFNRNKVLALGPENTDIIETAGTATAFFITKVGEPIGSYYLLVQDGIFSTQEQQDQYPHFANTAVGDFRFVDVDGDGILDVNKDRTIVGNYAPDFTYGFSNRFKYKNLDLNVAFQGSYGSEILNLSRRYNANGEGNFNNTTELLSRWRSEENPGSGNTNRANRKASGNNGRTSTWHVEDGSYLRLQNVSLGYSLPISTLEKLKISKARLFLTGNNLFTWTKYTGYNPEVNLDSANDQLTPGLDYGVYPLAKTYSLGINVSF